MTITVIANNLDALADRMMENPIIARKAASIAVNETAEWAEKRSYDEMTSDINLPKSYVRHRFGITEWSRPATLKAVIRGRDRATSLARFDAKPLGKGKGLSVRVLKSGSRKPMRKAFLMDLRNGNRGLAMRLKKGEEIKNRKIKAKSFSKTDPGLYLLYGPAVMQMFRRISAEVQPDVNSRLALNFNKHWNRLKNG